MSVANRFQALVVSDEWPRPADVRVTALGVSLHGSLSHTGIDPGAGRAVILGRMGEQPTEVDPDRMDDVVASVEQTGQVSPPGHSGAVMGGSPE